MLSLLVFLISTIFPVIPKNIASHYNCLLQFWMPRIHHTLMNFLSPFLYHQVTQFGGAVRSLFWHASCDISLYVTTTIFQPEEFKKVSYELRLYALFAYCTVVVLLFLLLFLVGPRLSLMLLMWEMSLFWQSTVIVPFVVVHTFPFHSISWIFKHFHFSRARARSNYSNIYVHSLK